MQKKPEKTISETFIKINIFHFLVLTIILLTAFTRLYGLGDRVMSHDEVNHVVPSYDLFTGRGYRHDPVTHGPLQFHLMALSYFLFGDNDFSSRLPHALFSIATVGFVMIYFKRYLGKIGAIAAGVFFAISPFMMFYGRYARNDAICAFLSVVAIYGLLRFLETGSKRYLLEFTAALSLNFATKETAYIFTALLMIFVFILTLMDTFKGGKNNIKPRNRFILVNILAIAGIAILTGISIFIARTTSNRILSGDLAFLLPNISGSYSLNEIFQTTLNLIRISLPMVIPLLFSLGLLYFLRDKLMWEFLGDSRAFSLLILCITFVLPILAPFLVRFSGQNPVAYSEPLAVLIDYIYLAYLSVLSMLIGFIWDKPMWWKYGLIFFGIYVVLYTTFFTNTTGLLTGPIGSLGHWLAQQGEKRGGQPYYYYALILLPFYEFLGIAGSVAAFIFGIKHRSFWTRPNEYSITRKTINEEGSETSAQSIPIPAIFLYLTITSLIAYSLAGEKMPWLTVHIVFPMLLTAGWTLDRIINKFLSLNTNKKRRTIQLVKVFIFVFLFLLTFYRLVGNEPPFQGKTQPQLQNTNHFLFLFIMVSAAGYLLIREFRNIQAKPILYTSLLAIFILLSLLTFRTTYEASFINYDYPYEFLVYAHAADGPKIVLDQIEEISRRTTQGKGIKVAYDNHGLYPYWWYLRDYPNKIVFLENPTRALEEAPLIIAGSDKYAKIDAITRDNYYAYEYMRLWWPMQDYWNLTFDRIKFAFLNPDMRQALFNIWLNRDYSLYAQITGNQFLTLENWLPSEKMRFYVRKDIAAQMWQLNNPASLQMIEITDPYAENMISRQPDLFIGREGNLAGDLKSPKGLDVYSDGSIFIADTNNNRIQHFSPTGELLNMWGTYANILVEEAPGGTLNQPWDVAISKDGSAFVVDTFNHRIVKFSGDGQFIKMIGIFAQGNGPDTLWGPRGIAIDLKNNILVTDTGNKRVVVYDSDLNYITQFGSAGFDKGQFDEPVGITVSETGDIAVADTWNRRIQVFEPDESGQIYIPITEFSVEAWFGQSLENKPFLTFSPYGTIIISDPEGSRLLEFTTEGKFIRGWHDLAVSSEFFSQPYGLDFDPEGNLWVSDSSMHILMRFDAQTQN